MMKRLRGQGLVETALILPVLLLLILGIIESALLIQGYITVQHAARSAARFAASYQPPQGACVDLDGDGINLSWENPGEIEDRAPRPYCPVDNTYDVGETLADYYDRRVALIKLWAREKAAGLRIDANALGLRESDFILYQEQPNFLGVRVWGYPSADADCESDPSLCRDHPGLEGLPVRVAVVHNVEIIDPFYRVIAPYITVRADSQMINEGLQVGTGNAPVGGFSWPADYEPPGGGGGEPTPTQSGPEPTVAPTTYFIELSASAFNELPDERGHQFVATVTDQALRPVKDAQVSFSTDGGGFSYSGVGPRYAEGRTDGAGQVAIIQYGNEPMTVTVRAWLDYNLDNTWDDPDEPSDTATKTWTVSGPYVTADKHQLYPLDWLYADVMDHDPLGNPYSLLWCAITTTTSITELVISDPVEVDPVTFDLENVGFEIPDGGFGLYQLETHESGGRCGAGYVARSAPIEVRETLPDLRVTSLVLPDQVCPSSVFTMTVTIENLAPAEATELFDVDIYVDPVGIPSEGQVGVVKQWVSGMGPREVITLTTLMWFGDEGAHDLYARVDTSDYVEEGDEGNNILDTPVMAGRLCEIDGQVSFPCTFDDTRQDGYILYPAADTGFLSPTGNEPDNGGFYRPERAYDNDYYRAEEENYADGVSHIYRDYGISIPAGQEVVGIEVRLDWWLDSTYSTSWIDVELSWDGGNSWSEVRSATTKRRGDGNPTDIEGSSTDRWGHTWTASELSDENFRVRLTLRTNSTYRDFYIDWVPVQVSYGSQRDKYWRDSSYEDVATVLGSNDLGDSYSSWDDFDDPDTDKADPPVLEYNVEFEHTGTYDVWVLGRPCAESARGCLGGESANDSVWVSLDGKPVSDNYFIADWGAGGLDWRHDGVQLNVGTPGIHSIELRMREDGFEWARVVMTNTGVAPLGEGPATTLCAGCAGEENDPPPWVDETKPPGLIECYQILDAGGFEGSAPTVFSHWSAGGSMAYALSANPVSDGAVSMLLRASLSTNIVGCAQEFALAPWLSQVVQLPSEVYTQTTFVLSGQRYVDSPPGTGDWDCSVPDCMEAPDRILAQANGGTGLEIVDGGAVTHTWAPFSVDLTSEVDPHSHPGGDVTLRLYGDHDEDDCGTWFYFDELTCDVCTEWPIPDPISGTASVGGQVRVVRLGIPSALPGVHVWAYTRGGDVYHTMTIQDGMFHFYNIPPNTAPDEYTIYTEAWIGGYLRNATTSVALDPDERNYSLTLTMHSS
jgi:hypothetical protein